jgi:hypothetical protein
VGVKSANKPWKAGLSDGATGSHVAIREVDKLLTKWFLADPRKTATVRIAAYLLVIYGGPGWT